MGAESVDYHRETVLGRADDHPGAALAYYASRGRRRCGGAAPAPSGSDWPARSRTRRTRRSSGRAAPVDPAFGVRLAATKRPGMELIVAAHKSVALLGLMGRAEDMHELLDAERDATLAYLDELTRRQGGRRGRAAVRHADVGPGVRPHPSRHVPGRRPRPPRSRADRQPGRDARRAGRVEGGGHGPVAGAPPRRHRRRPDGRRPPGGRVGLRHRTRRRRVGPAGPLAHRRHAGRGGGVVLQAVGRDRRGRRRGGLRQLPGPGRRRPHHPHGEAAHARRGPDGPLAGRAGRDRPAPRRPDPQRRAGRRRASGAGTGPDRRRVRPARRLGW